MTLSPLDWTIIWVVLGTMAIQAVAGLMEPLRKRTRTWFVIVVGLAWMLVVDVGIARLLHAGYGRVVLIDLIVTVIYAVSMLLLAGFVVLGITAAKK